VKTNTPTPPNPIRAKAAPMGLGSWLTPTHHPTVAAVVATTVGRVFD